MSQTYIGTLNVKVCPNCGVRYGLESAFDDRKSREGGSWYCPNGHSIVYSETEVDKLRKQLEEKERCLSIVRDSRDQAYARSRHVERSLITTRGHYTRIKTRVANGVCPCCKRTFQNLHNHMKHQHPKYIQEK